MQKIEYYHIKITGSGKTTALVSQAAFNQTVTSSIDGILADETTFSLTTKPGV
jgi:hypothetical protein